MAQIAHTLIATRTRLQVNLVPQLRQDRAQLSCSKEQEKLEAVVSADRARPLPRADGMYFDLWMSSCDWDLGLRVGNCRMRWADLSLSVIPNAFKSFQAVGSVSPDIKKRRDRSVAEACFVGACDGRSTLNCQRMHSLMFLILLLT